VKILRKSIEIKTLEKGVKLRHILVLIYHQRNNKFLIFFVTCAEKIKTKNFMALSLQEKLTQLIAIDIQVTQVSLKFVRKRVSGSSSDSCILIPQLLLASPK
jgi:hypothetical protein